MSRSSHLASLSAFALVLAIATTALAQPGRPDPAKLLAAQRDALTAQPGCCPVSAPVVGTL